MNAKRYRYRSGAPFLPAFIGSGFGVGFCPLGPGTAGAFLAALLWYVMSCFLADPELKLATLALVLLFYMLGVWAANRLSSYWGEDPSRVVIDEMDDAQAPRIALEADYGLELRGGIEGRNNDTEDFPEVSILAIQAMLEKAYLLGKADAQKTSH
jgi:hypothetical protein